MFILVPLTILSMFFYMYFYFRASGRLIFLLKTITSLLFLILGLVNYQKVQNNEIIGLFLLLGLFFGLLGDIGLGVRYLQPKRKSASFIIGLAMFFIGHIFYTCALVTLKSSEWFFYLILASFMTAIFIIINYKLKALFGKVKWIVYIYMFISSLVLSLAFVNYLTKTNRLNGILAIGALLFILSDMLLCQIYFRKLSHKALRIIKIISIITYYFGQILFALSLFYLG